MNRNTIFEQIIGLLREEGATRVAIFGSYARGEEKPGSDVDVIVEFSERKSLLELVRIEREICERVGTKVELLTEKSISPYIIDRVRDEMEVIYG